MFVSVGPVASVRVCRDQVRCAVCVVGCACVDATCVPCLRQTTRRSLGYGYVNYHTVEHGEWLGCALWGVQCVRVQLCFRRAGTRTFLPCVCVPPS